MDRPIVYSIGCPKCRVLEKKLSMSKVNFIIVDDEDVIRERGVESIPSLEVDGKLMEFGDAMRWAGEQNG
jgi:hypothetical protein